MRTFIAASIVGTALVATPAMESLEQVGRSTDSIERPFVSGGHVRMVLSAGEYRIEGTSESRVKVEWRVRDPGRLWRVKARADVNGSTATIETDGPSQDGVHAVILVPVRTDLDVRLSAGELVIEGVDGHKDVSLRAGEVTIDVDRPQDYRTVDASVWAGEIDAPAFNGSREGLFRSFDWRGNGTYRLRVSLWAGEVRLRSALPEARR
jgi:hypothetical protein